MRGARWLPSFCFAGLALAQSGTPGSREAAVGADELERLFRASLVVPFERPSVRVAVSPARWCLQVNAPPDLRLALPAGGVRWPDVTEAELTAAALAVQGAASTARAHVEYAKLLRRAAERWSDAPAAEERLSRVSAERLSQEHFLRADSLLRERDRSGMTEADILDHADALIGMKRAHEACDLVESAVLEGRGSWRSCLWLASWLRREFMSGIVRNPHVFLRDGLPVTNADGYLKKADELAAGDVEGRRKVDNARLQQAFEDVSRFFTHGGPEPLAAILARTRDILAREAPLDGATSADISEVRRRLLSHLLQKAMAVDIAKLRALRSPASVDGWNVALRSLLGVLTPGEAAYFDNVDAAMRLHDEKDEGGGEGALIRVMTAILRGDAALISARIAELRSASPGVDELITALMSEPLEPEARASLDCILGGPAARRSSTLVDWKAADQAFGGGDFATARAGFEAVLARAPESEHCRLAVALSRLLDADCRGDGARVEAVLRAIANPRGDEEGKPRFRAAAEAGLALLAIRAGDMGRAVACMETATRIDPTPESLRLRAGLERAAANAPDAPDERRAVLRLAALERLVQAIEGLEARPPRDADDADERRRRATILGEWCADALAWLDADHPQPRLGAVARLEARLLDVCILSAPRSEAVAGWNERLIANLSARVQADAAGEGERALLVDAIARGPGRGAEAEARLDLACRVAAEQWQCAGGADLSAAVRLARILLRSGKIDAAEQVLGDARRQEGAGSRRMLGQEVMAIEWMRMQILVQRIDEPAAIDKLRAICRPIVDRIADLPYVLILARIELTDGSPAALAAARELMTRLTADEQSEPLCLLLQSCLAAAEADLGSARIRLMTAVNRIRDKGWGETEWLVAPLMRGLADGAGPAAWREVLQEVIGADGIRVLTGR